MPVSDKAKQKPSTRQSVRAVAAKTLKGVLSGASLTRLLEEYSAKVSEADRGLFFELGYGSCRRYFQLEAVLRKLLQKPLRNRDLDIHALLIVGLYQLAFMRIKPHAVVQETVNAARHLKKPGMVKLVNGVLRNFQRNADALITETASNPLSALSMPAWLLASIKQDWPSQWQAIAEALLDPAPMTLRVNQSRQAVNQYKAALTDKGMTARPVKGIAGALMLDQAVPVSALPGFSEGWVSVQDAGAQLAALLLAPAENDLVLDACAAPGGKTSHMLERQSLDMVALDVDEKRLQRVAENLQRLGLSARLYAGDAAEPEGSWAAGQYDCILLDVPCSATGVIRRHPDIKLLRRPEDIDSLVAKQRQILTSIWPLLKPGGKLLYATCSIISRENDQQVAWFLKQQDNAREMSIDIIKDTDTDTAMEHIRCNHGIQLLPQKSGADGFYYALLQKAQ